MNNLWLGFLLLAVIILVMPALMLFCFVSPGLPLLNGGPVPEVVTLDLVAKNVAWFSLSCMGMGCLWLGVALHFLQQAIVKETASVTRATAETVAHQRMQYVLSRGE